MIQGVKLDFDNVMLVPQRSEMESRSSIILHREYSFPHSPSTLTCTGVIAANMDSTGTFEMARALAKFGMLTAIHKHYDVPSLAEFFSDKAIGEFAFYTVGSGWKDLDKIRSVRRECKRDDFPRLLCIDVPNGYARGFAETVKRYRRSYPSAIIMAGNIVTPNMAEELIFAGADIVKVGIGSGSVCLTRVKTGVGYPQLAAVDECAFAAHGKPRGHVCSDGGCKEAADVAKAFCAGADFVMIGGMLAGTDECGSQGWVNPLDKTQGYRYHGMASREAQDIHNGGLADYRAAEGKEVTLPYRGAVEGIAKDILGGLRGTGTMIGARCLKDFPKCSEFIEVRQTHNTVFGDSHG